MGKGVSKVCFCFGSRDDSFDAILGVFFAYSFCFMCVGCPKCK